ncbi:DMT family transporter [Coralliovum pocilloporae]|uniref:DMT family transporter n=1 Tax=Coralliovum pocilloporae TaxID=3066369 RepID=UPI003307B93B
MRSESGLAPLYSVAAAVSVLSIMDALIKDLSGTFTIAQIVTLRYGFGMLAAVPFFIMLTSPRLSANAFRTGFVRSLAIVATASSFFYALSVLPLAVAVTIAFTAPLFLVLLGALVLKEPITVQAIAGVFIGLLGVLLIMGPELVNGFGSEASLSGYLAALFASLGYAVALVLTRLHSSHDAPAAMVMVQTGFCALIVLPFGISAWTPPATLDWGQALIVGCLGTFGHLLMAWGFSRAEASRLGPIEYVAFLWAIVIGYFFFGEVPGWWVLSGAGLIILACVVVARRPAAPNSAGALMDEIKSDGGN